MTCSPTTATCRPESAGEKVYGSTPYPADKMILWHNESAHLPTWPLRQFFYCVIPSQDRGTTPLIDCRLILDRLDPEVREQFATKGLKYVRNFSEGIDVPWQDFFKTDDKAEVERMCAEGGMSCEWTDNGLRISQDAKAVRNHVRTGEPLFFNQVQLHHISCLDEETRTALRSLFDDEDLPRNVYFGDGTPIPDEVMDQHRRAVRGDLRRVPVAGARPDRGRQHDHLARPPAVQRPAQAAGGDGPHDQRRRSRRRRGLSHS